MGFLHRWEAFFGSAMDVEDDVAESSYASLPTGQADPAASAILSSASRKADERPVDAEVPRTLRSPEREPVWRVEANAEALAGFGRRSFFLKVGKVKWLLLPYPSPLPLPFPLLAVNGGVHHMFVCVVSAEGAR